jgi:hypothetical protein
MSSNLKEAINENNIPKEIGDYEFQYLTDFDNELMIRYLSSDDGYFTIIIYGDDSEEVPLDINDPIMVEEHQAAVDVVFQMEDEGKYTDVQLIINEPFSFEESDEQFFQSAIFTYNRINHEENTIEPEFSILFLRGDGGYFHKIRYSIVQGSPEESLDKMHKFLEEWMKYIFSVNAVVN